MGNFWSVIIGALVGALAAGGISFWLQRMTLRAAAEERQTERRERRAALGHALLFKTGRIYSHARTFSEHMRAAYAAAKRDGFKGEAWQFVLPILNFPDRVEYTTDEMALLLSLKENELFNCLIQLDEIHNSTIEIFRRYAELRLSLTQKLSPHEMRGKIGSGNLTPAELMRIQPSMIELNDVAEGLQSRCQRDEAESWKALVELQRVLKSALGLEYRFEKAERAPN
jgi:hypothetical protein